MGETTKIQKRLEALAEKWTKEAKEWRAAARAKEFGWSESSDALDKAILAVEAQHARKNARIVAGHARAILGVIDKLQRNHP